MSEPEVHHIAESARIEKEADFVFSLLPVPSTVDEIGERIARHADGDRAEEDRIREIINRWISRGDGVAVYENQDFGHPDLGVQSFASYGSEASQFPGDPPGRLPDFQGHINWRYGLVALYRGTERV